MPRLAPYSHRLDDSGGTIAVLTGSDAWGRAASRSWFAGTKLVLPFRENPEAFTWPVEGVDCMLCSFGTSEPREALARLSVLLLEYGCLFVIWVNIPGDGTPATLYCPTCHGGGNG